MNRPLLRLATVLAMLALAAGCKRKEADDDVADEAEKALPATEQVPKGDDKPAGDVPRPLDGTTGNSDFEAWFKKYRLDLNDPKMLDADPDGDGFSNRDEFLADTSPIDGAAFPGVHKVIHLQSFTEVRLPLVLEAVEGDRARIKRTDGDTKPELVKVGDSIKGMPLSVQRVEQVLDTDKEGKPIDRSIVVLEDSSNKERLTLVRDMPARTAASFAMLTSADGNATLKVKQGDTFKWPGDDSATYKVIDLRDDQVVLQQVENKKMWTVTRMAPGGAAKDAGR